MSKISINDSASSRIAKSMGVTNAKMTKIATNISTGQKSIADDVAGSGIAARLSNQIRSMTQATNNTRQGKSMLSTAEAGLQVIMESLQRMKELTVQVQSADIGESDAASLNFELQQQRQEINRIANSTNFNGKFLLNGVIANTGYQTGFKGDVLDTSGTEKANGSLLVNTRDSASAKKYKANDRGAGIKNITFATDSKDGPISVSFQNVKENQGVMRVRNNATNKFQDIDIIGRIATGTTRTLYFDQLGVTIELDDRFNVGSGRVNDFANFNADFGERINDIDILNTVGGTHALKVNANTSGNNNVKIAATHGELLGITTGTITINAATAATSTLTLAATTASGGNFTSSTVNLSTTGAKTVTLSRANASGNGYDAITVQFTVNTAVADGDTITLQMNELADSRISTGTINTAAVVSAGGGTITANSAGQNDNIKIVNTTGNIYGIQNGLAYFDMTTAASATLNLAAVSATDGTTAHNFTSVGTIDMTATGQKNVVLRRIDPNDNTKSDTIEVQFTVGAAFANGNTGSIDLQQLRNPLNLNNRVIQTSGTGRIAANSATLNSLTNDKIQIVGSSGKISGLTKGSLSISVVDDATNGKLTIAAESQDYDTAKGQFKTNADGTPIMVQNNFELENVNLTQLGERSYTLVRRHKDNPNEVDTITVKFDITTAFVNGDTTATVVALNQMKHILFVDHEVSQAAQLRFQVGTGSSADDRIALDLQGVTSEQLGLSDDDNIKTKEAASIIAAKIDEAINRVLDRIAVIGATSNRLDKASDILAASIENFESAKDTLIAVDLPTESVKHVGAVLEFQIKNAMLAKTNSLRENILRLLQ